MKMIQKMKKLLLVAMLFVGGYSGFAQTDGMAVIKAKLNVEELPADLTMTLFKVVDGQVVEHSKVAVEKDGTFGFCFTPEYSGIYRIGERSAQARLYITPGKQTSIELSFDGFKVLTSSDIQNKKMAEWEGIISKLKRANMLIGNITYKDIFPLLAEIEKNKNNFIASVKTGNKVFDKLMTDIANAEFEYELYHFLFMPRSAHPDLKDYPAIYEKISSGEHFATTEALKFDFGRQFISGYIQFLWSTISKKEKGDGPSKLSLDYTNLLCLENIKNDTIKGWYFLDKELLRAKSYDRTYVEKAEKYKKYILSPSQKKKLSDFELTIRKFAEGEQAINFEGSTIDGKKVSLSDFKGKVVLVDVWATWCGPCKAEIPALKALEAEMHGKDVVFMSYSVDKQKDLKKWEDFVKDKKLGGVQLIGNNAFESPICVDYKINSIPRFLVFDKKGGIVSIAAPRPSSPDLKKLLEEEVAK